MFESMTKEAAIKSILDSVRAYYLTFMREQLPVAQPYKDGGRIPYAGRNYDERELVNLVDSSLEFWLTAGRFTGQFEKQFGEYLKIPYVSLVNSGSSANLLAFMALTSPLLDERAIQRGDEVITVAAAFPTTVSPVVQYGAVPVFVDITIPQYNIDVSRLEDARSQKTKAVFLAHSLGNPFDLQSVKTFCDKYHLWLIEDNCDALGAAYTIDGEERLTGTIGDIGTSSFYPAHHITMGEGGAVYTRDPLLHKIIRSLRDWGRDCVCPGGRDNLCGHRFNGQYGELPLGYDHKYVYSHLGYNLKVTDMQAAIGCAQLEKLPGFVEKRWQNWRYLYDGLAGLQEKIILPEAAPRSNPSWFGFIMTCREKGASAALIRHIEEAGVQTRRLFAGNILRHPCFDALRKTGAGCRVSGGLDVTDRVMNDSFWVGVHPGMTSPMLDRMIEVIGEGVQ